MSRPLSIPERETVTYNGREFPVVRWGAPAARTAPPANKRAKYAIPLDGAPVASGELRLTMAPPSVNGLFFNRGSRRGKTLAYRTWCKAADLEITQQPHWHVAGLVNILVRVGGSSADSDNMLKASLDCLVRCGRIQGDGPKHVHSSNAVHDDTITGTLITIERAE